MMRASSATSRPESRSAESAGSRGSAKSQQVHQVAAKVEDGLESLYEEDLAKKLVGAQKLLELAKQRHFIPQLVEHATLLGALARVFKDEGRKSTELSTALLQIFHCFSHFVDFHAALTANRIGESCMKLLELEIRRHEARSVDLRRFQRLSELQTAKDAEGEQAFRTEDAAQLKATATSASAEDSKAGPTAQPRKPALSLKPLPPGVIDIEKERLKARVLSRKQVTVLAPCLAILRNLADDVSVERKMCGRGIVALLVSLLTMDSPLLAVLSLGFLRKLSIFEENKDAMAALDIGQVLLPMLGGSGTDNAASVPSGSKSNSNCGEEGEMAVEVKVSVLRLMFNLCFDRDLCASFVASGAVAHIAALLRKPAYRAAALPLLYHISQDESHRLAFIECDALMLVHKLVVAFPQERLPSELAALAVNLAMHPASAQHLLQASLGVRGEGPLKALVARASRTCDVGVLKVLRGLAWHTFCLQAEAHDAAAAAEETAFVDLVVIERRKERLAAAASADNQDEDDDGDDHAPVDFGLMPDEPVEYAYQYDGLWAPHVRELVHVAHKVMPLSPEALAQALGILSCLSRRDLAAGSLSWAAYVSDPAFLGLLCQCLECRPLPRDENDDVILAALQLLAAVALDAGCAEPLAASDVGDLLSTVLAERKSDPDILLQACCAVGRLLHHAPTRATLISDDDHALPLHLVELIAHPHPAVTSEAEACMGIIIDCLSDELGQGAPLVEHLKARRFNLYNREFVAAVASEVAKERSAAAVSGRPVTSSGRRPSTAAGSTGSGGGGGGRPSTAALQQQSAFGDVSGGRPESRRSSQDMAMLMQQQQQQQQQPSSGATSGHPSAVAAEAYRRMGLEALQQGQQGRSAAGTGTSMIGGMRIGGLGDDDITAGDGRPNSGSRSGGGFDYYDDEEGEEDHEDASDVSDSGDVDEEMRAMMSQYHLAPRTGTLDPRPASSHQQHTQHHQRRQSTASASASSSHSAASGGPDRSAHQQHLQHTHSASSDAGRAPSGGSAAGPGGGIPRSSTSRPGTATSGSSGGGYGGGGVAAGGARR